MWTSALSRQYYGWRAQICLKQACHTKALLCHHISSKYSVAVDDPRRTQNLLTQYYIINAQQQVNKAAIQWHVPRCRFYPCSSRAGKSSAQASVAAQNANAWMPCHWCAHVYPGLTGSLATVARVTTQLGPAHKQCKRRSSIDHRWRMT